MAIERTGSLRGRRAWPLLLLLAGSATVYALGLHRQLSLDWLVAQREAMRTAVQAHPELAPLAFTAFYAAMVACAIPGGIVLSTAAGLLFGVLPGTACVLVGVTAGSVALLLAARTALRPVVERHAGALLGRIVAAVERDGFSYLLAVRLLPFAPFWMTNLAAALTRIRVAPFALATVVGITPITLVLTATGAGIGDTLDRGAAPTFASLLRPQLTVPLLLSAALSLAPIAVRRRQLGRKSGTER